MSIRSFSLSTVSLLALTLTLSPSFAQAADTVVFDTHAVITGAASATAMTGATNPNLTGAGTSTTPTFTATGANNSVVTINGTYTSDLNFNAITVQGDNAHGAMDSFTTTTFTGTASGNGTGSALYANSTGAWNDFTLSSGASLTSGSAGSSAAFLANAIGTTTMGLVNHGTLTGTGGMAAFREAATSNSNVTLSTDGTVTASGAGNAVDMRSVAANHDVSVSVTGGSVTASGAGSAIYLANTANAGNTVAVSAGTVSSASAAAAIDVSAATVAASTINVSGGTVSGNGVATGTAIKIGQATDTVNVTGGTITGKVITAVDGNGIITFGATNGFTTNGDIGQVAAKLATATVNSGVVTFANNVYANAINLNGGIATLGASTVATGATTLRFGGGTLNLGTKTLGLGAATLNSAVGTSTVNLTVGATANGKISSTGALTNNLAAGGHTVNIAPTFSNFAANSGDKFVVFSGMATTTNLSVASSGSLLSSWALSGTGVGGTDAYGSAYAGNNVLMTFTRNNAASIASLTANQTVAVDAGNGSRAPTNVANALRTLTTATAVADAGDQLRPEINRGGVEVATNAIMSNLSTVGDRQNSLRSGVSSGEKPWGVSAWVQGFGFGADQAERKGANGYDATASGVVFGADKAIASRVRLGGSFAFAKTELNEKGTNEGNKMDITSYQGTVYGSYNAMPWYVDGALNFGLHQYDTTRQIVFGGLSDTASSKHDGYQTTARVDGGYPIQTSLLTVTPVAGLTYSHLQQESYEETSANGSALSVGELSSNSLRSTLGAKFSRDFKKGTYKYSPELRAAWGHEFIDDALTTNASFVSGGSSFSTTSVKPAQDAALMGAGLTLKMVNNLSFTANYDAEIKEGYTGHTGSLRVKADF